MQLVGLKEIIIESRDRHMRQGTAHEREVQRVVKALEQALATNNPGEQEAALIELADLDRAQATRRGYAMFKALAGESNGSAARLLLHFTGQTKPTIEQLEALNPGDNFLGMLVSEAFGELGASAVPMLLRALRTPGAMHVEEEYRWWTEETRKYRILHALARIGPPAADAVPDLIACLLDDEAYRDTHWKAEQALIAIGSEAAAGLCVALQQQPTYPLLEALFHMSSHVLRAMPDLPQVIAGLSQQAELAALGQMIIEKLNEDE